MTSFTLIAEFSHEIPQTVRGDDASDDRWSVKIFTDGSNGTTREITAVGCCRLSRLKRGQTFTLCGQWIDSDRFGRQFKFDSLTETQPISLEAIQRYLKKSLGIGPKKAAAIVGEYGESALDKCRDAPVTVGIKCGIPDEVMRDLAAMLRAGKAMERVTIELDSLLAGHYFPKSTTQWALEKWRADAARTIRENPFVLREKQGIGFLKCDALYASLGLDPHAMIRQVHCLLYYLESDNVGHTWLPMAVIADELRKKIGGTKVNLREAINQAKEQNFIREHDGYFAVAANADSESSLANDLAGAMREGIDDDGF